MLKYITQIKNMKTVRLFDEIETITGEKRVNINNSNMTISQLIRYGALCLFEILSLKTFARS